MQALPKRAIAIIKRFKLDCDVTESLRFIAVAKMQRKLLVLRSCGIVCCSAKDPAFQASSPKNFTPPFAGGFLVSCNRAPGWRPPGCGMSLSWRPCPSDRTMVCSAWLAGAPASARDAGRCRTGGLRLTGRQHRCGKKDPAGFSSDARRSDRISIRRLAHAVYLPASRRWRSMCTGTC